MQKQKYDLLRNFHGFFAILVGIFAPWQTSVNIFVIVMLIYLSMMSQMALYFISSDYRFNSPVESFFSSASNLMLCLLFLVVLPIQIIWIQILYFAHGAYESTNAFLPLTKLLLGFTFILLLAFVKLDIRSNEMELINHPSLLELS